MTRNLFLAILLCAPGCTKETPPPNPGTNVSISWKVRIPTSTTASRPPVSIVFRDWLTGEQIKIAAPTGTVDPTDSNYKIYEATGTILQQDHDYTVLVLDNNPEPDMYGHYPMTTGEGGNIIAVDELQDASLLTGPADLGTIE